MNCGHWMLIVVKQFVIAYSRVLQILKCGRNNVHHCSLCTSKIAEIKTTYDIRCNHCPLEDIGIVCSVHRTMCSYHQHSCVFRAQPAPCDYVYDIYRWIYVIRVPICRNNVWIFRWFLCLFIQRVYLFCDFKIFVDRSEKVWVLWTKGVFIYFITSNMPNVRGLAFCAIKWNQNRFRFKKKKIYNKSNVQEVVDKVSRKLYVSRH